MPELGEKTYKNALCIFGALSVFLAGIEYALPKPLPFLRLGLSNMPIMLALFFDKKSFALLVIIKIICGAVFTGSLFSYIFVFSAAGSAVSAFFMYLFRNKKNISFAGLGTIGALSSNITQIILARYLVLGKGALYIAPAVIGSGIISGFALGLFCSSFAEKSLWYKKIKDISFNKINAPYSNVFNKKAFIYFLGGAVLSLSVIISSDIKIKTVLFFFVFILFIILRKKNNYLLTFIFMLSIMFFNIIFPQGKVLFNIGLFKLTEGALFDGLKKALTLESLIFISRIFVKKELSFKGKLGGLICETFAVLSVLNENKKLMRRGNLIESIDELLITKLSEQAD